MGRGLSGAGRAALAALAIALAIVAAGAGAGAHASGGGSAPGPADHRPLIVGGHKANTADWGFAVGVRERRVGFFCTGSLIAPDAVLTAAHCVKRSRVRRMRVTTGTPWAAGEPVGRSIPVRRARIEPDYKGRLDRRDVAVLRLKSPSPAQPVALPTPREAKRATKPGRVVRSAGWGARNPFGFRLAKRLKATRERVRTNRSCVRYFRRSDFDPRSMICVLGAPSPRRVGGIRFKTTSCSGDSGGPLVAGTRSGPRLVGVVSAGPIPCGVGPSIYARVSAELRFIRRAAGLDASP